MASALAVAIGALSVPSAPAAAAESKTVTTIWLHDRGDISDASPINAAISALSHDADSCSPRTETCICSFTDSVDRLSEAYRNAVARHPSWGQPSTGVEYVDPANGGTVGVVVSNVRRQLDFCGRP
jgi:hypothetical protein